MRACAFVRVRARGRAGGRGAIGWKGRARGARVGRFCARLKAQWLPFRRGGGTLGMLIMFGGGGGRASRSRAWKEGWGCTLRTERREGEGCIVTSAMTDARARAFRLIHTFASTRMNGGARRGPSVRERAPYGRRGG